MMMLGSYYRFIDSEENFKHFCSTLDRISSQVEEKAKWQAADIIREIMGKDDNENSPD